MRKTVVGLAMATGAIFAPNAMEAGAQTPEMCVPVYDETINGDSSTYLRDVIDGYAVEGIEVHVQIIDDATDNGVRDEGDAERFAERVENQCDWQDEDVINVFISKNPRVYDIYRTGQAELDISDSAVANVEDDFISDLRNTGTNNQNDVANLLNRVNPYDSQSVEYDGYQEIPGFSSEDNNEPLNIPVKQILVVSGLLVALGAAGTRLKRGLTVRNLFKESREQSDATKSRATSAVMAAESQLSPLPEDDALELRDKLSSAQNELIDIINSQDSALNAYSQQKKKIWPNKDLVFGAAEDLDEANIEADSVIEQLEIETSQVGEYVVKIESQSSEFDVLVELLYRNIEIARASGWDISSYGKRTADVDTNHEEIKRLRGLNYIERPAELIIDQTEVINKFVSEVSTLEERRTAADANHELRDQKVTEFQSKISGAVELLNSLKSNYHPSCTESIVDTDNLLEKDLSDLLAIRAESEQFKGVKSVSSLESDEKTQSDFENLLADIDSKIKTVESRDQQLKDIVENLNLNIGDISGVLSNTHDYAFSKHYEDVEPDTRQLIEELTSSFNGYVDNNVNQDKPKYLEISSKLEEFKNKVSSVRERAVSEKREMDELRSSVTSLEQEAEIKLSSLRSYVSIHGSDTSVSAGGYSILQGNTSASRNELRNQVNEFNDVITAIQNAKSRAEADVRQAEAERERERELERQRQDRDRLRLSQSYHSSSNYSSPSYDSGGSGSHDSGSY
jgi:hypothetical protein